MTHLIDKDALVAEIEKRKTLCEKIVLDLRTKENIDYYQGEAEAYKVTIDLLNTLEVKEVDIDIDKEIGKFFGDDDWKASAFEEEQRDMIKFAKHFFELGIKA